MFIDSTPPPSHSIDEKKIPLYHLGQTAITSPKLIRNQEEILSFAKQLPKEGILKKGASFIYLDLPNEYIFDLIAVLNEPGIEPPPYFQDEKAIGANICAILDEEFSEMAQIEEIGKKISFTITGCSSVKPYGWDFIDKAYILTVHSPELEQIREKYGLSPKINGHEFHIIFAVKKAKDSLSFDVSKLIADPSSLSSFERA